MYTQYDVIVLVAILIFTTVSLFKGGVKSLLGIAKWYGAFFIALAFYPYAKTLAEDIVADSTIANAGAVVVVYIIALIFLAVIGAIIVRAFGGFIGSIPDIIFGGVIGFAIGYIIASSVHYGIEYFFKEDQPDWFKEAKTYEFTKRGSDLMSSYLDGSLKDVTDELGFETDKAGKLKISEEKMQEIMNSKKVQELVNDPKIQEMAREKVEEIKNSVGDMDINKIVERANALKELGYDPDEIKSIIEQEMQMNGN